MASEKVTSILEEIKGLSVIELFDLEKAIEEEFGVSAAAVVATGVLVAATDFAASVFFVSGICFSPPHIALKLFISLKQ